MLLVTFQTKVETEKSESIVHKTDLCKRRRGRGEKGESYLRTPATSQKKHLEEIF